MASYTDSPQAFLPHEVNNADIIHEYDQGLQTKQYQYNQGVQRIQNSYDSVAGLDVSREVDKQYLQSKLGDLTTQLNQMGGGDFSNQSLVAQATSLAPRLVRDPNITAALSSTQSIRSLQTSSKALKAKSPELYPLQQEWRDNQEVSKYLNNQELGATYNGPREASRYKNYRPDLNAQLKEIVPDVKWEINPDGQFQYKKDKYDTVTNDRIQNVISSYFATNPDAQNSLETDALYTYRYHTPEALAQQAKISYSKNAEQLEAINSKYLNDIKNNGKDADFVANRTAAILANQKTIQGMKESVLGTTDSNGRFVEGSYMQALRDPNQFDMVKKTIFGDNLKAEYSTIFQKDNVSREIVENYNAKNQMENYWKGISASQAHLNTVLEATKAGYKYDENGRLVSLKPDDPEYATYYAQLKKGKRGDKEDEGHTYGQSFLAGKDATGKLSNNYVDNNLVDLDNAMTSQKNEYFTHWKGANGSSTIADFDKYLKAQGELFLAGDPTVNSEYLKYRSITDSYQRDMDANLELRAQAQKYGIEQVPGLTNKKLLITGLNYQKDGKPINQLYIDLDKNPGFIDDLAKLRDHFQAGQTGNDPKIKAGWKSPTIVYNEIADTYLKGSPNYNQIKGLINGGAGTNAIDEAFNKVLHPVDNLTSKRIDKENEFLKGKSKDFATWESPHADKDADLGDVKRTIVSLLGINQGLGYNKDKYKDSGIPKEVEPLGVQVNAAGQAVYHFKWGENKEDYVTDTSPGSGEKIPGYDVFAGVKRNIELVGHTPLIGEGTLHTYDGKIRYQIKKAYGGGYSCSVIDHGTLIGERTAPDVTQLIQSMEQFNTQPSITGKPMTRQEAYYRFTHSEEDYKNKYALQQ